MNIQQILYKAQKHKLELRIQDLHALRTGVDRSCKVWDKIANLKLDISRIEETLVVGKEEVTQEYINQVKGGVLFYLVIALTASIFIYKIL